MLLPVPSGRFIGGGDGYQQPGPTRHYAHSKASPVNRGAPHPVKMQLQTKNKEAFQPGRRGAEPTQRSSVLALCDIPAAEALGSLHPFSIQGQGPRCKALTLGRALAWSLQSSIHQPSDCRQGVRGMWEGQWAPAEVT